MNAVRQSCRPKHQVLVLKCYPKFQKNVAEVKPNGSELSYLLYYASTRRSKVQKVGAFLEKKTASDVSRGKNGNVQVTLQILRALIEKSPRDLPLYAQYVLQILSLILNSRDINMVEESIPTWEKFCEHHDVATLTADQAHVKRYEDVVRAYASFAGSAPPKTKGPMGAPMAIRWKSAGVQAIKCITSSDTVGADGGRQLNIIMPMILRNLYSDRPGYLVHLQQKSKANEKSEKESLTRRRMSMATVRTVDTIPDIDPAATSGTTADADRFAEEEVGLTALQALNQIYVANNRAQIRIATTAMLKFFSGKVARDVEIQNGKQNATITWATNLLEIAARWTPVQDRFIILVTTMETLVRSPVMEENLQQQLLLVTLVGYLLSSTINMIGLSVMDVLLGLIQHILLLLQLGGKGSNVLPHHQQTDAIDLFKDIKGFVDQPSQTEAGQHDSSHDVSTPSAARQELLTRLQKCIGDLATHIYYSDQISDMIAAILLRLKPSATSAISSTAAAIEAPAAAAQAISDSVNLQEDPSTDSFFSFGTARVTALNAIKGVLTVANTKKSVSGAGAVGRNRVGVQTWEGTQWLLRDEDRRVRRAYVDALLTWLKLEMSPGDLRVMEDKRATKGDAKTTRDGDRTASLTRRVVSNASQRSKTGKPAKSTFLQLLHLAIYNNATELPGSESDMLLLHLLMANLIDKLGVNAVKSGLPMMARLQEDISLDSLIPTPVAKINTASLVHGYLLALCEKFELDTSLVGYGIQNEVHRRRQAGLWLDGVRIPPLSIDQVMSANYVPLMDRKPLNELERESLKPFDAWHSLVDQIAINYASTGASPPTSPPSSPSRVFSLPILTSSGPSSSTDHELPSSFKEAMLASWTKESCIATVERDSAPSASIHGSRAGTNNSGRNGLLTATDHTPRDLSPARLHSPGFPPQKQRHQNGDARPGRVALLPIQHGQPYQPSPRGTGPPTPLSSSDQQPTLRVDDLKRVLAGGALADAFSHRPHTAHIRGASPLRETHAFSDKPDRPAEGATSQDSDSIVSASSFESASEGDPTHPLPPPQVSPLLHEHPHHQPFPSSPSRTVPRPNSKDYARHTRSSSSASIEDPDANARALKGEIVAPIIHGPGDGADEEEVPPVPPLPPGLALAANSSIVHKMNAAARMSNGSTAGSTTTFKRPMTAGAATERKGGSEVTVGGRNSSKGRGSTRRASLDRSLRRMSLDRNSLRAAGPEERKVLMQQLLSGIEVGDGKGVGRPPY